MPRRKRSTAVAPAAADVNPFQAFASEASAIDGQYREALKQVEDSGLPPEHKKQLEVELAELLQEQIQTLCTHRDTFAPRDRSKLAYDTETTGRNQTRCEDAPSSATWSESRNGGAA